MTPLTKFWATISQEIEPEISCGLLEKVAFATFSTVSGSPRQNEQPQIIRTVQKAPGRKYRVLVGEASRQRCLSSLKLDTLVIVKVDISVNHPVGL